MTKCALLIVVVVVACGASVSARPSKVTTLVVAGDLCNGVCEFSLCVGHGKRPAVTLCAPDEADMTVLVDRLITDDIGMPRTSRLKIGGTTVRLECRLLGAACQPRCTTDIECRDYNFRPSRCVDGYCMARPTCPY